MRKVFVLICCSIALLFLGSACESKEDDAVELGEKFIKELYNVDDPNMDANKMSTEQLIEVQSEFSTYFTEKEFNELSSKRLFLIPTEVAFGLNNTISVQNIVLKEDRDQGKGESLYFDHSFTLIFTNQDERKVDELEIRGQMTIVDTEDGLKIDRYYDGKNLMDMLNPIK